MLLLSLLLAPADAGCVENDTISCHESIVAVTGTAPNDESTNSCQTTPALLGADTTYKFQPPAGLEVHVEVANTLFTPFDVDLYVEDDTCACVGSSNFATYAQPDGLTWVADGSAVYITVDNEVSANAEYELKAGCSEACTLDVATTRTCGFTIAGDTTLGTNHMSYYGCLNSLIYGSRLQPGPEVVYEWVPELSGKVGIELRNFIWDHDLVVMRDTCEQSSCFKAGGTDTGREFVQFQAVAGTHYFLVVESTEGTPGPFELQVAYLDGQTCGEDCTNGVDDDNNGDLDCADDNCIDDPYCCDKDDDGFKAPECGGQDCDDAEPTAGPQMMELCDGIDNNCDGQVDEDLDGVFYPDADGDLYGDLENPYQGCEPPADYIERGGDCDDADPDVFPDRSEICDGKDNDCNPVTAVDLGCEEDKAPVAAKSCGCSASSSLGGGLWVWALPLLALGRRRPAPRR